MFFKLKRNGFEYKCGFDAILCIKNGKNPSNPEAFLTKKSLLHKLIIFQKMLIFQ